MMQNRLLGFVCATMVVVGLAVAGCSGGTEKGTTGTAGTSAQGGSTASGGSSTGGSTGGASTGGTGTGGTSTGGTGAGGTSSSSGTSTSTFSEAEIKEACDAFANATCDAYQACTPYTLELLFGDLAACKQRLTLSNTICDLYLSVPDGPTPAEFKACAAALEKVSCDSGFPAISPPECYAFYKGTRPDGAPCAGGPQCAGGRCITSNSSCGTCGPALKAGGACTDLYDCAQPLQCSKKTGQCQAIPDTENAPCDLQSYPSCAPPLVCITSGTSVCKTPQPLGAACNGTDLVCDANLGQQCNVVSKKCETVKLAAAGEMCGANLATGTLTLCKGAPFGCDNPSGMGTCAAPVPDGGACTPKDHCLIGAICKNGVCTIPPPPVPVMCN